MPEHHIDDPCSSWKDSEQKQATKEPHDESYSYGEYSPQKKESKPYEPSSDYGNGQAFGRTLPGGGQL